MPVPSTIADLTTSEATNSPADSETITATTRPSDYLRAHAAIIKTLAGSVTTDIAAHAAAADPHTVYALESALGTASTKNTGITSGTVPLVGTSSATEALAGLVELATTAEAANGTDTSRAITPAGLKGGFNATGNAPLYACRAWVNFNGTLAAASMIQSSGNVSSITDNGTGDYTINFTTAMPDENYSWAGSARSGTINGWINGSTVTAQTSSALRISAITLGPAAFDPSIVCVAIFR